MTALLAPATGDEALDYGWAVLYRAEEPPWPAGSYDVIAGAAQELRDSLELSETMTGLGWDRSPTLAGCTQGVAEDITAQARVLADVIGKHIDAAAAAIVRGEDRGGK